MTYNKSEIMRYAWARHKDSLQTYTVKIGSGYTCTFEERTRYTRTFTSCLEEAWRVAKQKARVQAKAEAERKAQEDFDNHAVKATALNVGDTIKFGYLARPDEEVTAIVTRLEEIDIWGVPHLNVHIVSANGFVRPAICVEPEELVYVAKTAVTAELQAVA